MKALVSFAAALALAGVAANASDHLDSPTVIADPRADIGDIYAWMSPDARRLNLVMTIVGHSFSDKIDYVFHIDSGHRFGRTTITTDLVCRFASATAADCRLGTRDRASGDASQVEGLVSAGGTFRVFAGLRDDPFFNNVRGTRDAYNVTMRLLRSGATYDAAGCPLFSAAQSREILEHWRQTDGHAVTNFLKGWTPDSIVVSVDVGAVAGGGRLLAVWGATVGPAGQIDRAARPLTGNALFATLGSAEEGNALKERYNRATPRDAVQFVPELAKGVALYDGFDGQCGNGLRADRKAPPARRYWPLAALLADDRLWIDSRSGRCTQLLGVERRIVGDCGGRTPNYDSVNVYRSLLTTGTVSGMDDGVHSDEKLHSTTDFPFLAAPDPTAK